ncbi:MAG: hypothetical protein HYU80_03470 [Candidatus Blackburnbacteria bacterium]|nr:hypothetical protein [Candidatus Blackburnbacteria bacterium]
MQQGFTKNEILMVGLILTIIWGLALFNFRTSLVRARDVQRKNDLKHIATALNMYLNDFASYPPARDGKIFACGEIEKPSPCEWGKDGIRDITDSSYPPYIDRIPEDPLAPGKKYSYLYVTDGKNFQLFAHLENSKDDEYKEGVARRKLACGSQICNFGVASGDTPVEKELEAIEKDVVLMRKTQASESTDSANSAK